jgi:hypothetical protein
VLLLAEMGSNLGGDAGTVNKIAWRRNRGGTSRAARTPLSGASVHVSILQARIVPGGMDHVAHPGIQ